MSWYLHTETPFNAWARQVLTKIKAYCKTYESLRAKLNQAPAFLTDMICEPAKSIGKG